jgi:hypothetical protein
MKMTAISPFCVEIEQSETEWLHDRLQSNIHRAGVQGEWKQTRPDMMIYTQIHRLLVNRMKKFRMT